jgi:hypothetical protein
MVMKKYDKTFDEMKKEFEKERSPKKLHDMLDMILKYILDNFDIFMSPNVRYKYEINVDKNDDFIIELEMHGSMSDIETSLYSIDKAITKSLKVRPEDKAYDEVTSGTVKIMYRIKKEIVQHIKMSEIERELGKIAIEIASEQFKHEREISEFFKKMMGEKRRGR